MNLSEPLELNSLLKEKIAAIKARTEYKIKPIWMVKFNYRYYRSIDSLISLEDSSTLNEDTQFCLLAFFSLEGNSNLKLLTSNYEIATMLPREDLLVMACGVKNNFLNIQYDAAKLGIICALNLKINGIGLLESINLLLT